MAFYVSTNGGAPKYLKTKKSDVLSLFSDDDYSEIKKYVKGKHLDFGDSRDLMNLFAYANTL